MKSTNLLVYLLVLSMFAALSACTKDEKEEPKAEHKDAFGDVFVKKVLSPKGDKYGLVFYAGGKGLTECTVKSPDGKDYKLAEFWKGAGNMRRHPEAQDMQGKMPSTGKYVFTLKFSDGQSIQLTDVLSNVEIPAIKGVKVNHKEGSDEVEVMWESVSGVNNYMVKLTDNQKNKQKPIFVNKKLTSNDKSYKFNKSTKAAPGWMREIPAAGSECYVMVVGVKYEEGVSAAAKDQNKQMNTVKPVKIKW